MLPHLTIPPTDDPRELYRLRDSMAAVDLFAAALVWLDLFSDLDRAPADLPTLCARLGIAPRPTDVVLTLSKALGLVVERAGIFEVTPKGRAFCVADSPFSVAPYYAQSKDRPQTTDLLNVLRTGVPANWGSRDPHAWAQAMEEPAFAARFTAAMDCRGLVLGQALAHQLDFSSRTALLDIAGGSGIYACTIAARHPDLRATVFEKAPVDRLARAAILRAGLGARVGVVSGDFFHDPLPAGYDVHLLSNVLHDWDTAKVEEILKRSSTALSTGGWLVIHGAHLNEAKDGPLPVACYSALLMSITEGRCYSTGEMRMFLDHAGLDWVVCGETAIDRSYILARKR